VDTSPRYSWNIGYPTAADVIATFYNDTLTINGSGAMQNWSSSTDNAVNTPWYYLRNNITTVVINDDVTTIGAFAFSYCSSLSSVTISNRVDSIANYAFSSCRNLVSITNLSFVPQNIRDSVFASCNIRRLIVPACGSEYQDHRIWSKYFGAIEASLECPFEVQMVNAIPQSDGSLLVDCDATYSSVIFKDADEYTVKFGYKGSQIEDNDIYINEQMPYNTTITYHVYNKANTAFISRDLTIRKKSVAPDSFVARRYDKLLYATDDTVVDGEWFKIINGEWQSIGTGLFYWAPENEDLAGSAEYRATFITAAGETLNICPFSGATLLASLTVYTKLTVYP
ncbi:leucine-rich repeat domain-containing protein, partial [Candidatus Symbiothrix dinenymphae]|uniref:leucine-rich repeat domain-containing protein n=1 Tax=Candidatus Symbiothrix dinenymphae TaxID=467085 RepID=UPI0013152BF6